MRFLVVIAALFASATLVAPTVAQGQFGDDAKDVSSDANELHA